MPAGRLLYLPLLRRDHLHPLPHLRPDSLQAPGQVSVLAAPRLPSLLLPFFCCYLGEVNASDLRSYHPYVRAQHAGSIYMHPSSLNLLFCLSFFQSLSRSIAMAVPTPMVCEPLSDTSTYTYFDLDNGFTPPSSCLHHNLTSAPDGHDYYVSFTTFTMGSKTKTSISPDVCRGRDPACFPPNFPAACSYTGTFTQAVGQLYVDAPALPQPSTEMTGAT